MGEMERSIESKIGGMDAAQLGQYLDGVMAEHAAAAADTAAALNESDGVIAILKKADNDLTEAGEEIAGMLLHDPPDDEEVATLSIKQ